MKKNFKFTKIIAIAVVAAMLAMALVSCGIGGKASGAQDASGDIDGLHWDYQRETTTLKITGNGAMKNFQSATDVPWASVTASVKTIVIGEGVTTVGDFAFAFCSALESVKIANTVTSIGNYAFTASSLRSADLPASVTSIGNRAFEYCDDLVTVVVRGEITELSDETFSYCNSLKNVYLPAAMEGKVITIKKDVTVTAKAVSADTPDASIPPVEETKPAETDAPTENVESTTETDVPQNNGEGEKKMTVGTIIAIVALAVVVIGLIVGVILFIRYDKKHSGNTTTVRKNKDEKGKKGKKDTKKKK